MPALRIDIRTKLISLVAALPGFNAQAVSASKLDKVEKAPAGSVYLKGISNEPGANRGNMARTASVNVSLFIDDADAEAKCASLLNELEKSVETARRASEFGNVSMVYLASADLAHDATSKGKRCDLHAVFEFTFAEDIL